MKGTALPGRLLSDAWASRPRPPSLVHRLVRRRAESSWRPTNPVRIAGATGNDQARRLTQAAPATSSIPLSALPGHAPLSALRRKRRAAAGEALVRPATVLPAPLSADASNCLL